MTSVDARLILYAFHFKCFCTWFHCICGYFGLIRRNLFDYEMNWMPIFIGHCIHANFSIPLSLPCKQQSSVSKRKNAKEPTKKNANILHVYAFFVCVCVLKWLNCKWLQAAESLHFNNVSTKFQIHLWKVFQLLSK